MRIEDGTGELFSVPGIGWVFGNVLALPQDGAPGYGHGCILIKTNGTGASDSVYQNIGTQNSCDFNQLNLASDAPITDAGGFTATATIEAALQEIYQNLLTAQASIPLSLSAFREVDANGDVGDVTANGGILASDTTPIFRADANESQEIAWATGNVDPIALQISLPTDLDDTGNVTLDLWVYSGTTDAATFTVETSWGGAALVSDSASDSALKSATVHKVTATIDAGDVPANAGFVTIALTPTNAHATNAYQLCGARLNYKRKILTS